jgi:hypothetical protein
VYRDKPDEKILTLFIAFQEGAWELRENFDLRAVNEI